MKMHSTRQADRADPVQIVDRLDGFDAILGDEVDAVIWRRRPPPSIMSTLARLRPTKVASDRACVSVDEVSDRVSAFLNQTTLVDKQAHEWLREDAENLARQFVQLVPPHRILLRVEWVCDNACRRFHRDRVKARLICTYTGPGTQFGIADEGEQPTRIESVPTGSAVLLKGKLWPTAPHMPVVHRSPPIEGTHTPRLVIVMNEVSTEVH